MVENVAQIKSGITIISGMSVKIQRTSCEKNIFEILVHVLVKTVNTQ